MRHESPESVADLTIEDVTPRTERGAVGSTKQMSTARQYGRTRAKIWLERTSAANGGQSALARRLDVSKQYLAKLCDADEITANLALGDVMAMPPAFMRACAQMLMDAADDAEKSPNKGISIEIRGLLIGAAVGAMHQELALALADGDVDPVEKASILRLLVRAEEHMAKMKQQIGGLA